MTSHRIQMASSVTSLLITLMIVNCVLPCHIEKDEQNYGQIIRCNNGNLTDFEELSKIKGISKIDLRNNRIFSLKNISIPDTGNVEWIDLRGNQLSILNQTDLDMLFRNAKRRILLSNNPFICDCEFIVAINEFQEQIEDFQNITCLDSDRKPQNLSEKMCSKTSYSLAFIITAGVVFIIKITLLAFWYRNYMKRFFYKHGCCKCCCKGEESDNVVWQSVDPAKSYSQQDLIERDAQE